MYDQFGARETAQSKRKKWKFQISVTNHQLEVRETLYNFTIIILPIIYQILFSETGDYFVP